MARYQGVKKKETGPDKLYRVFRVSDGQLAYLPSPGRNGLPLEDAQQLSDRLQVETEVRLVWERPEE